MKTSFGKYNRQASNGRNTFSGSSHTLHHSHHSTNEADLVSMRKISKTNEGSMSQTNLSTVRKTAATTHH